jgi:thioesterase-3
MITQTPHTVRSTELDAYGHVNNAKYLEYFEWGRFDWVSALALPPEVVQQLSFAVVNISVNYRKEARLGDALTVSTRLVERTRSTMKIAQEITNARGERVADALVTGVAFDLTTRKARPVPSEVASSLDQVLEPLELRS